MTVQGPRNDVISVTIYDTAPPVESVCGRPTKKKKKLNTCVCIRRARKQMAARARGSVNETRFGSGKK